MQTHLIIAILFVITLILSYIEDYLKDIHKAVILTGYVTFMILLATTKSVEHTADALSYETMFYHNDNVLNEIATEPTFIYLSKLILACEGTIGTMFFIYAIITIPLKVFALSKMTPYIFSALLIYIPIYFEVQDMIQIRAAAAATFLLSSILPLSRKQYLLSAILMICGIFFHYSAVAYLPFLLIGNRRLNQTWRIIIACVLPILIIMYLFKKDFLSLLPSDWLGGKIEFYKKTTEKGEWGSGFSPFYMVYIWIKCIMLFLCLYYYKYITEKSPLTPILINLFIASIFVILVFSSIPIISGRIGELYGIIDCIVFTFCMLVIQPKYMAKTSIALIGLYMLLHNIFFTEYFT